eukprot:c38614_g1_i1 orf=32-193(+)
MHNGANQTATGILPEPGQHGAVWFGLVLMVCKGHERWLAKIIRSCFVEGEQAV